MMHIINKEDDSTLFGVYMRTLKNCQFYLDHGDVDHLLNEIGVLRGLCYALEIAGIDVSDDRKFLSFIEFQNSRLN